MATFDAKQDLVRGRAQKVQKLSIPLTITANATPASKVVHTDEPSILFVNVEGIVGISTGTGALATGEVPPSLQSATDSTGVINVCVLIGETMVKVMHLELISRDVSAAGGYLKAGEILALSTGTGGGQSIFANITTGVNLASTGIDACLVVEYIVEQ